MDSAAEPTNKETRIVTEVYLCDGIRTPIGRYAGCLSMIRTDDLAAIPLRGCWSGIPTWIGRLSTMWSWAAPINRARITATWPA